ncbi:diacylglycerol kinase family protein [Salimicrobium halophilum]|uniref:Diacylglycerol kinase (ATP) n=1 Tax=Salimicrobium halophilum TaxID=86666 RepID=A0A1G8PQ68_9BACI|nr:diacylglycerol kinase family protein [Salimicrobium halophilum]SDI94689.1 diacylglycerol kinase (ATP) [Salimicrobium halophilum]
MSSASKDPKGKKWIGFRFAISGLIEMIRKERNLKIHLGASVMVVLSGVYFSVSAMEWAILFLTIALVTSLEVMNSVVERVMDFIHPAYHDRVKVIKDAAAGAVLIAAIFAVLIAIVIFVPKL